MTVLDCLKPLTLSAVGNDDRMLRNKIFVLYKFPGVRDTINCQNARPPGLIVHQMPWFCTGGCSRQELTHTLIPQISICSCEWLGRLKCLATGLDRSDPLFFTSSKCSRKRSPSHRQTDRQTDRKRQRSSLGKLFLDCKRHHQLIEK